MSKAKISEIRGFDRFIEKRGKTKEFGKPSNSTIVQYQNKLPDFLIKVWQTYGFASYANGLFFVTSPEPFEQIVNLYFGKEHTYTVFSHTSFGDLLLWDSEKPSVISLNANTGRGVRMVDDGDIDGFFAFGMNNDRFYKVHRYELHLKAVEKFGQLEPDQVFAFVPALALGGSEKLGSIKVVQLREYLAIIAELAVENNREAAVEDA